MVSGNPSYRIETLDRTHMSSLFLRNSGRLVVTILYLFIYVATQM